MTVPDTDFSWSVEASVSGGLLILDPRILNTKGQSLSSPGGDATELVIFHLVLMVTFDPSLIISTGSSKDLILSGHS